MIKVLELDDENDSSSQKKHIVENIRGTSIRKGKLFIRHCIILRPKTM